ncbi:hypothetical protein ASG29_10420 [Sphingomonas sp. Leaf412]|uniref:DUF1178 family protein n=1 Tax=Sphingomonas sp. Leaf412 TaxID=1736370 RepID=UPI0006F4CA08|nr:DUF1178 family protein [Sphingomonas sp. Leaf412]KQT32229.1 hypothetical protein ASG29_10420 [Sphingomonas sp. Leaf412]
MIVFDLRCGGGHVFETWFASSAAFEDQRDRGLIACPMCGDGDVAKAVMAPRVTAKGNATSASARLKAVLAEIAAAQGKALTGSRWVGRRFAEEARAMHDGAAEPVTIHGQATREEARALLEDGVPVAPLLLPVTPPKALN